MQVTIPGVPVAQFVSSLADGKPPGTVILSRLGLTLGVIILLVAAIALLVAVGIRVPSDFELSSNEGWNAYHQTALANGSALYPARGSLSFNNYPPLSFLIIGLVYPLVGDPILAGRIIALGALIGLTAMVMVIVRILSPRASGRLGPLVAGGTALVVLCGTFSHPSFAGMNDPQFLGMFFMACGLSVYVRGEPDKSCLHALPFLLLGILIKHNLIAIPLAVGLDIILRVPRRGVLFALVVMISGGIAAALIEVVFGPGAIHQILAGRRYSVSQAVSLSILTLKDIQLPLFIGLMGLILLKQSDRSRVVLLYLVIALLTGAFFAGGAGTSINMFFDVAIAMSMAIGLTVDCLVAIGTPLCQYLAALAVLGTTIGLATSQTHYTAELISSSVRGYSAQTAAFRADVSYLRRRPDSAICDSIMICFRAGKPPADLYTATRAVLPDQPWPIGLPDLVAQQKFATIELNPINTARVLDPAYPVARGGWPITEEFLDEVRRHYRLDRRSDLGGYFVPL